MKRISLAASLLSFVAGLFSPNANAADYQLAQAYSGLRDMVFGTKPDSIGVKVKDAAEVWGVVMETGYPEAVVSLVALADGTVSLYFSNGGGIIGLGPHAGPQRAAQSFLGAAQQSSRLAQPTTSYPLPKPSYTRFYWLTGNGSLTAEAKEDDLGNDRHPLSPLFYKGHELISEVRAVEQKLRSQQIGPKKRSAPPTATP